VKLPHEMCTTNDSSPILSGHHSEHNNKNILGESHVSVRSKFRIDAVDCLSISYKRSVIYSDNTVEYISMLCCFCFIC